MKALFAIFGLALSACFFSASAQVTVDVTVDQDQFLPGEAIPLAVHVTNRSGRMIRLGDGDWLTFYIQSSDGSVVTKKSDPPVDGEFFLDSLEVGTKRVDVAPYFNLSRMGSYRVTANVHIKDWNTDISSAPKNFDLIEGAQLWSQTFGVPDTGAVNQPPTVRKYSLIQANYLKDQLRLYVQVTDESGAVFKVLAIGPMISFSQPEAQLDRLSNLHVLCQSGATAFTYSVIDPNGKAILRDTYDYIGTRPRLSETSSGNIAVSGGVRRVKPGEMPVVQAPAEIAH
jgi:hypothetical protein